MMHIKFAKRIWPPNEQKSTVAAYEIPKKKMVAKIGRYRTYAQTSATRNQLNIHCDGSGANNEIYK